MTSEKEKNHCEEIQVAISKKEIQIIMDDIVNTMGNAIRGLNANSLIDDVFLIIEHKIRRYKELREIKEAMSTEENR